MKKRNGSYATKSEIIDTPPIGALINCVDEASRPCRPTPGPLTPGGLTPGRLYVSPNGQNRVASAITPVSPENLKYEVSLAKKLTESLGFLPRESLQYYAVNQGVWRQHLNGQPAGFAVLAWSRVRDPLTAQIYQLATQQDAQRLWLARDLIDHLATLAKARGVQRLTCWCAADLESNYFWRAMGFDIRQVVDGGKKRRRHLILWIKRLVPEEEIVNETRVHRKRMSPTYWPLDRGGAGTAQPGSFLIPY